MAAKFLVHLHLHRNRLGGNVIGFADRRMRLQKTKAILELDIKSILPAKITGMLDTGEGSRTERLFKLNGDFHSRPCF